MQRSQYLAAALDSIGKPPPTTSQPMMDPAMMQQQAPQMQTGWGQLAQRAMGGQPGGISLSGAGQMGQPQQQHRMGGLFDLVRRFGGGGGR